MVEVELSGDELAELLVRLAKTENVCVIDSCGVRGGESNLLIGGIRPLETVEISAGGLHEILKLLDNKLSSEAAAIFTISYDFGLTLQNIRARHRKPSSRQNEPDIFFSVYDYLIVHEYETGRSFITGAGRHSPRAIEKLLRRNDEPCNESDVNVTVTSNFSKGAYLSTVARIKDYIRSGDTYQTNLTQQLRLRSTRDIDAAAVFLRLRRDHPVPFAAFLKRSDSTVVSASPERFFKISEGVITSSPIKGTRPRGSTDAEDAMILHDLLISEKDRAENTMIVDLVRNDLGRICEFGSVEVQRLCEVHEYPTLFHLESTVSGKLFRGTGFSDVIKAVFPCGSITGAPKHRTMHIIDEIEPTNRGLSMGAIGCYIPGSFGIAETMIDVSVAIRTMVVRVNEAVFNVGGGIVIDSDPEKEFDESLLKARALLNAVGQGSEHFLSLGV